MNAMDWLERRAELKGKAHVKTAFDGDFVECRASMGKRRWTYKWSINGQRCTRRDAVYYTRRTKMETEPGEK